MWFKYSNRPNFFVYVHPQENSGDKNCTVTVPFRFTSRKIVPLEFSIHSLRRNDMFSGMFRAVQNCVYAWSEEDVSLLNDVALNPLNSFLLMEYSRSITYCNIKLLYVLGINQSFSINPLSNLKNPTRIWTSCSPIVSLCDCSCWV